MLQIPDAQENSSEPGQESLCPLRDHSGGETENEISSCGVCQPVIRVPESEEGKRESGGGGMHF